MRLLLLVMVIGLSGCTSLLFYPTDAWVQNPARQGLDYEDIILIHPDGLRLHGWWLPAQGEVKGTVYFLHGNAQNISTHVMNVKWLPQQGYQVFLLDYRGYGLSEGEPDLPEVFSDIQLGLDWLQQSGRLQGEPLTVFGQSLGGAMATYVLAQPENQGHYDCAILEAVFTGYTDIARDVASRSWLLWPWQWPLAWSMPEDYAPIDHVAALAGTPVLIRHSSEDQIIPFAHGKALFAAAKPPKYFDKVSGRHISSSSDSEVQQRTLKFMQDECW